MKRWLILVVACVACDADGTLRDAMPDDLPAGACRDTDAEDCETSSTGDGVTVGTTGGTTGGAPADDCTDSASCLGQDACVAAWDPQTESRGPYVCQFACIPLLDETSWCSDDASCCDAAAVCTPRGYCVLAETDGDSGTGSSSGGGS